MNAAIRGSTAALFRLALIEDSSHFQTAKSAEDKKKYALKVMSWYRLATLRGDRWPELSNGQYFLTSNGITLTELDDKNINAIADNVYKNMQNSRIKLGLDEFDNTVPDSVVRNLDAYVSENNLIKP